MRTVTFSNPRVAEVVNAKFVPVWFNRGRGFHNCERRTEKWIFESYGEAYPTKNICTFFLTPELRVVSYVSGYFAPDLFLEVLAAAGVLKDAEGDDFATRQRRIANDLAGRREKPAMPLKYRDLNHRHTDKCGAVVEEALRHRREVHDSLAVSGPVPLEKVQHAYLYGNPFTEEAHAEEGEPAAFPRPKVATRP